MIVLNKRRITLQVDGHPNSLVNDYTIDIDQKGLPEGAKENQNTISTRKKMDKIKPDSEKRMDGKKRESDEWKEKGHGEKGMDGKRVSESCTVVRAQLCSNRLHRRTNAPQLFLFIFSYSVFIYFLPTRIVIQNS